MEKAHFNAKIFMFDIYSKFLVLKENAFVLKWLKLLKVEWMGGGEIVTLMVN